MERKLLRRACAQGEEDYVKQLKREEPREFTKLCKAFGKAVKPGQKAASFCVASWKRHVGVRSGQRSSLKRKWMWEREYMEFQGTTAQGSARKSLSGVFAEWTDIVPAHRLLAAPACTVAGPAPDSHVLQTPMMESIYARGHHGRMR